MTVAQLIEKLSAYPQDASVLLWSEDEEDFVEPDESHFVLNKFGNVIV